MLTSSDDAGLWRAGRLGHLVEQDPNQRIRRSGEGNTEIVEHTLPRERAHRSGQISVCQGARSFGDSQGKLGFLCAVRYYVVHPFTPIHPRSIFQSFV